MEMRSAEPLDQRTLFRLFRRTIDQSEKEKALKIMEFDPQVKQPFIELFRKFTKDDLPAVGESLDVGIAVDTIP